MMDIIYNAIRTPDGTVLHSKHRHDFIMYKDKNGKEYGVDGGNEYLRRIGDTKDCKDLSVQDDGNHETRRTYIHWGRNYDKQMQRLKMTEWIPIKGLSTDHIEAILANVTNIDPLYRETFENELRYRKPNQWP